MKWTEFERVVTMIWLWTLANFTRVNSTKQHNVKYQVMNANSLSNIRMTPSPTPINENEVLSIQILEKSTSSITINWRLQDNFVLNKTILGSKVEYFVQSGNWKFSTHMLQSHINTFTCEHLQSSTSYTICVSVFLNNFVLVTKCVIIDTIPYMRNDSILILAVNLGYYFLMGLIGVWQWKRRRHLNASKNRRTSVVENNKNNVSAGCFRELEERERLTNPSACSIEDSLRK